MTDLSFADLRGRIRAKYGQQANFAAAMGMHPSTLSAKLREETDWTREEMIRAAQLLELSILEVPDYFEM